MCKQITVILIILVKINLSAQQLCDSYCLSDEISDNNCVNKSEIKTNAIIYKINGTVDYQFDFVCKTDIYKIELRYCYTNCYFENIVFKSHSTYNFMKKRYFKEANTQQFDNCSERGRVLLQNVQTGCYKIQILNEENYIIYENKSFWTTSYTRHIVDLSKNKTTYASRNNGTELIFILKNSILNFNPEFSLQFQCKDCSKLSYDLMPEKNNSKKLVLNPKHNHTQLNISCTLEQNNKNKSEDGTASCVISPVTIGYYNIVIIYAGDPYKCGHYYLEDYQIRSEYIVVEADAPLQHFLSHQNYFETIIGPLLGVACILLSLIVIVVIIKLTQANIRKIDENLSNIKVNVDDLCETPNVLLLYARNSEDVMTILASLRNIFMYQGIQVYDIYDPDRLREIHENYHNWILNLTTRNHIKIIIVLTPNGRNPSQLPELQNSIDSIYPFAIKQLLNQISSDCEFSKKIFVAHFSNDTCQYPEYDSFSPNLRFRVPDDLMVLLQHILNITKIVLNNNSNNEYNKLKENYKKYICIQNDINNHI